MEPLPLLIAAVITLLALEVGDRARRRDTRERRTIPVSARTNLPSDDTDVSVASDQILPGAGQWSKPATKSEVPRDNRPESSLLTAKNRREIELAIAPP